MAILLCFLCLLNVGGPLPRDEPSQRPGATMMEPDPHWKSLGRSLWFDPEKKQLIIRARVVLREGQLEHLLSIKGFKDHESILGTDAEPWQIHTGLLLTGAEPGHPARFEPKFEAPTGAPITIELLWIAAGKPALTDARTWVKDEKTGKPLARRWVFAGSDFYDDPIRKKRVYAAEDGNLITVANFGSSILDLPLASSSDNAERVYSANTAQVPALGTEVFLRLGPARRNR